MKPEHEALVKRLNDHLTMSTFTSSTSLWAEYEQQRKLSADAIVSLSARVAELETLAASWRETAETIAEQEHDQRERADALQRVIDEARGREAVAHARIYRTGGNAGIAWYAEPTGIHVKDGEPLYAASIPAQPSASSAVRALDMLSVAALDHYTPYMICVPTEKWVEAMGIAGEEVAQPSAPVAQPIDIEAHINSLQFSDDHTRTIVAGNLRHLHRLMTQPSPLKETPIVQGNSSAGPIAHNVVVLRDDCTCPMCKRFNHAVD